MGEFIEQKGVCVVGAKDEVDADAMIGKDVITLVETHEEVLVIVDNTDIFNSRLQCIRRYQNNHADKRDRINISTIQVALGKSLIETLHTVSGCDTTSSVYGIATPKAIKHLKN